MDFKITAPYKPTGDQPEAIDQLVKGLAEKNRYQTLLGVTGSGKTFTMANVIERTQRPTLILSHNKTLAAQLYGEMKQFFPDNAVEYFVSYYDYYQPEAYLPGSDTYIEKDLAINKEIEKLRLSTTSALLSGRRDIVVVSSVSCIYGMGNPDDFHDNTTTIAVHQTISRDMFLHKLVDALYSRNEVEFQRGNFRVKGDTVDVFLPYKDIAIRVIFWGDEIDEISTLDPLTGNTIDQLDNISFFPASIFVTTKERMKSAIQAIEIDLGKQVDFFEEIGKPQEAKRIKQRVEYDIEMMMELGYCPGIENYSRYFDGRKSGTRPFCLLDYFPNDFLTIMDESHATIPQVRAMYGGDHSRKINLIEYGFRLPATIDNRPLKFEEFENLTGQVIYASATPSDYELEKSEGVIVEQIIRPTGVLDPEIEIRPSKNQIDDLINEIHIRIKKGERILVTTLTKRMAEELSKYLNRMGINTTYIHSDIKTMERIQIMDELRKGVFDVLVGINLLREGLDLPEVSLVAIIDADKEGFLRSERSLTQTAGRAARNLNGKVIMYGDRITNSMQKTIDSTNYRRKRQIEYNKEHNVTPQALIKPMREIVGYEYQTEQNTSATGPDIANDPVIKYMNADDLQKLIDKTKKDMSKAAKNLDFIEAARLRDDLYKLKELLLKKEK